MIFVFRQLLVALLSVSLVFPACAETKTTATGTVTDTYDANGNTAASQGLGYVYDFENHLVQAGAGISIVYDGDGNRVSKTVAGVTTTYLVDDQNPTGYAQVLYESTQNVTPSMTYIYGLELVGRQRTYYSSSVSQWIYEAIYYLYDGHGSVRALTDQTGAVTDTYDYGW